MNSNCVYILKVLSKDIPVYLQVFLIGYYLFLIFFIIGGGGGYMYYSVHKYLHFLI